MRKIILVPVGHVFAESAVKVRSAIEQVKPDAVAVELCPARFYALKNKKRPDYRAIIRKGHILAAILSFIQEKIGKELGVAAGEEMLAAVEEAEKQGIPVIFIDRSIMSTMERLSSICLLEKLRLFFSFTGRDRVSLEDLRRQDVVDSLVLEIKKRHPQIYRVLIEERDFIMAENLKKANYETIVAIVGAGHVPGMKRFLSAQREE